MADEASRSIQVLNISNVNAQGKTVLNDGKLLELIQKYPFLYNARVRAYNDNDFSVWAWKNINAAFNHSYANDPNAAFSTDDLIKRWHVLKPLIQCLSKAYDQEAIPQALRMSVIKISTELEDQKCNAIIKPNTPAQNLLLQNMCSIAELPMEKKLELEREILDLILSSELERKVTKLDDAAWKEIHQDTEDFLNEIGFKEMILTTINQSENTSHLNYSNQHSKMGNSKKSKTLGWIPLKDVHKFIKPCEVRVQRINIEDYLPLSKIIQMRRKREEKAAYLRESPGIFGI